MVRITLSDGSIKEFEKGMSILDIAKSISDGLARIAIAAKLNNNLVDISTTITTDSNLEIITSKNEDSLHILRHTTAHIFAQAVSRLFKNAKITIGPAIDNGFYYDIDCNELNDEILPKIELEMKKIIKENLPIEIIYRTKEEALKFFKNNEYKKELIEAISSGKLSEEEQEEISFDENNKFKFYKQGEFEDLCVGPHLPKTGMIKAFKLDKVTKAYWRADANNKQLTRVYGTAFWKKTEMDEYYTMLEEAKKRDHRIIGKQMDLFCFSELVGSGLPLFAPRGTILREELQNEVERISKMYGFQKVITPHLAKIDLYKTSGHADKFSEELFRVTSERKHDFALKPVQCPHQTQIYASRTRSYRDLPIRYMESEKQYRAEMSGAVGGMSRVYAITVEDGHSFCRVDQVKQEVINMIKIIKEFYNALGLFENFWVSLSVRDYDNLQNYIGEEKDWNLCENMLAEISDEMGLNAKKCEGEAALYGPKLDFMFKDVFGKEIQIPTVQLDFATPKRFNLKYINEKGEEDYPVMVHRAILGSYERLFVLLIEHFAGKFPLWLAPVQVKILNVADRHVNYCNEIKNKLLEKGFRVETNFDNEGIGKKIALARENDKPNYMLILGDKDIENKTISVRTRKFENGKNEEFTTSINEFIENIIKERDSKEIKN